MSRMIRKQLYLDAELDRELAERAKELGVSQADLVRRAVAGFLHAERPNARERALAELEQSWAESNRRGVGGRGRRWTREELHER